MGKVIYEGCTVPSCEREHRSSGFCNLHLTRYRRGVPMEMELQRTGPQGDNECVVPSCERDYYAKTFCRYHYERNRKGIPFDQEYGKRQKGQYPPCPGPECDQPGDIKGLCKSHYSQQNKGYELTPVNRIKAQPLTENGRVCSKCRVFKPSSEYYIRSGGNIHSICKRCMVAMAGIRQYERNPNRTRPDWAYAYCEEVGIIEKSDSPSTQ